MEQSVWNGKSYNIIHKALKTGGLFMLKKLVAVERLNLTPNANEEFAKRAEEYIFYDDILQTSLSTVQTCATSACAAACTMKTVQA